MKTLLVPCAGSRTINGIPLFLNKYPDRKLLGIKSIEGIYPEEYDRIIYIFLEEIEKKYNVTEILKSLLKNVEVVILPNMTTGPAETVYQALKSANVSGQFVVRDSHSYVKMKENMCGDFIVGLDLLKYEHTIDNLKDKSFVKLNEQNQVLDIVEKQFCANTISVGVYGFCSAKEYINTYEHLINSNYPIEKLYLSHIISYLIGYNKKLFRCVDVIEYEDWSTLNMWNLMQKKKATIFLDFDVLCNSTIPVDSQILEKLSKLCDQGIKINLFTSLKQINFEQIVSYFKKNKIDINNVIKDCNYSEMKKIVSTEDEINKLIVSDD